MIDISSFFIAIVDVFVDFGRVFPNPSSGLTCIEINNSKGFNGALELFDILGKKIATIHHGNFIKGDSLDVPTLLGKFRPSE